ncbi:hypothetical protein B0T16DRAFT_462771 [Cercophora newfieldiana]|uniref:Uncharacterized protein n=1 Tax=Cercophora newfieldiana TaxID=92897 RepID=A0AA40CJ47_9PEZI|nr:hypothetical protein B0T16DRAFT_462771 [Cercophora newfieldiana]
MESYPIYISTVYETEYAGTVYITTTDTQSHSGNETSYMEVTPHPSTGAAPTTCTTHAHVETTHCSSMHAVPTGTQGYEHETYSHPVVTPFLPIEATPSTSVDLPTTAVANATPTTPLTTAELTSLASADVTTFMSMTSLEPIISLPSSELTSFMTTLAPSTFLTSVKPSITSGMVPPPSMGTPTSTASRNTEAQDQGYWTGGIIAAFAILGICILLILAMIAVCLWNCHTSKRRRTDIEGAGAGAGVHLDDLEGCTTIDDEGCTVRIREYTKSNGTTVVETTRSRPGFVHAMAIRTKRNGTRYETHRMQSDTERTIQLLDGQVIPGRNIRVDNYRVGSGLAPGGVGEFMVAP